MAKNSEKGRRDRFAALQAAENGQPATAEPQIRSRPANENDPATAMLLAHLRRQPNYNVYVPAIVISIVWGFLFLIANKETVVNLINGQVGARHQRLGHGSSAARPMAVVPSRLPIIFGTPSACARSRKFSCNPRSACSVRRMSPPKA